MVELKTKRDVISKRSNYSSKHKLYYSSSTEEWKFTEKTKQNGEIKTGKRRLYLHIFYDDQRATDDKIDFNDTLDKLEEELLSGKWKSEHEKLYNKYYTIKKTPVRGVSLIPKQEAIDEVKNRYGYFVLISNGIKDPLEALEIYRGKDLIEKAFGNLKERLNMRRTSVSSAENLDGKLFVQFIGLIYLSYIQKTMTDNNLFSKYTMQELLDELDVIERYEQPGQKCFIGEMTVKQTDLYKYFDVKPPA